jgi:hypothetical protein
MLEDSAGARRVARDLTHAYGGRDGGTSSGDHADPRIAPRDGCARADRSRSGRAASADRSTRAGNGGAGSDDAPTHAGATSADLRLPVNARAERSRSRER